MPLLDQQKLNHVVYMIFTIVVTTVLKVHFVN